MILTELQIEGFRRFSSPVRLDGLGAGLNVLAAPNEAGKSTLLAALRAALTLRHTSKTSVIKGFAPYGGGAPHVGVKFLWKGTACALEKRFLTKSRARFSIGSEIFEGDQAEEKLRDLLGLTEAGKAEAAGLWNALLVGQGESFFQPQLTDVGHASLRDCLEQGVEDATGGAAASAVLARVKDRLGLFQTASTNKPTGRYKQVLEQEQQAREGLARLEARKAALEDDLIALDHARRTLREQENPERRAQDEAALKELRIVRDRVLLLDAEEQKARSVLAAAAAAHDAARLEQEKRQENALRQQQLERECSAAKQTLDAVANQLVKARQKFEACLQQREQAERTHQTCRQQRIAASRFAALAHLQRVVEQEKAIVRRAEAAFTRLEQEEAVLAALRIDEAAIQRIRKAAQAYDQAVTVQAANAPTLVVSLEPDAAQRVSLNGQPCADGETRLTSLTTLRIEGIGQFQIIPAQQEQEAAEAQRVTARTQLDKLLEQVGCPSVADAELGYEAHRQAVVRVAEARAAYGASLPENTALTPEKARQALGLLRQQVAQKEADLAVAQKESSAQQAEALSLTPEQAAAAEEAAAQAAETARQAERAEQAACAMVTTQKEKAEAALHNLVQMVQQLQREDAVRAARETAEALAERALQAQKDQKAAQHKVEQLAQARQDDQPLAVVETGIKRLEQALDTTRTAITRLREDIRGRETRVRLAEGEGVDEQIAEARRTAERLRLECESCERERAALALLQQTLADAERTQTERYLAPLMRTVQPAFAAVFPSATIGLDAGFSVQSLTRRQTEDFSALSDGTREQISVLVRLGFAELLYTRQGSSILVLDDALSFSDSLRLERMVDVLAEAATRFQILVLTCRTETAVKLGGRALTLTPTPEFTELR